MNTHSARVVVIIAAFDANCAIANYNSLRYASKVRMTQGYSTELNRKLATKKKKHQNICSNRGGGGDDGDGGGEAHIDSFMSFGW